ncbi:MAG: zinc-binding alcohol dehydrogenase family protein [Verrucomicrobia bacterium]|nr:zinc-binding alcohol dehydrogenase family protein [Verrucomicrobiota bacterium]
MIAIQISTPGQIGITEISAGPELGSGDVRLQMKVVGYCGSDLSTFQGRNPMVSFPRIPGHEVGAVILETGSGVPDSFQSGMTVTVSPYTSCGKCAACQSGRNNACENNETLGVQRDGALRPELVIPWQRVIPNSNLSFAELALVEPLSVGFHAVSRGRVQPGDTVAVIGCGVIGLGAIAGAADAGARVIALDVADSKLELARACGAAEVVNSMESDPAEQLSAMTNGLGPKVIIEAVGLPATFRFAVDAVSYTGTVVYIGYAKTPVEYDTSLFVKKEIDIRGSRNALPEDFDRVIQYLEKRLLPLDQVISKTVSLAEGPQAMEDWAANPGDITKIHVNV